jgi:hypothetical protein
MQEFLVTHGRNCYLPINHPMFDATIQCSCDQLPRYAVYGELLLTSHSSQNQEDVPGARPQLVRVDRHSHSNMHIPFLVRSHTLARRHDHTIFLR